MIEITEAFPKTYLKVAELSMNGITVEISNAMHLMIPVPIGTHIELIAPAGTFHALIPILVLDDSETARKDGILVEVLTNMIDLLTREFGNLLEPQGG